MPWSKKSKNAIPSVTLKSKNTAEPALKEQKIATQSDTLFILTPDGYRILVGSPEELQLIYREGFDDWSLKTRIES